MSAVVRRIWSRRASSKPILFERELGRGINRFRWADYAFGEKTYLVLSLAAKSLLAWQIFAVSLVA